MARIRSVAIAALFLCAFAFRAYPFTYDWTGGSSTNWSLPGNWTSGDGGTLYPGSTVGTADTANVGTAPLYPTLGAALNNPLLALNITGNATLTIGVNFGTQTVTMNSATATLTSSGVFSINVSDSYSISAGTVGGTITWVMSGTVGAAHTMDSTATLTTVNITAATGTFTATSPLNAGILLVSGNPIDLAFNGGGTITNAVTFNNTGALTIPLGFAFTGGATKTVAGAKNFAGAITTGNAALDFGTTAVTLTGITTFNAGTGLVTLGATTGSFDLIIQGSGGATIASANLGAAAGTLNLSGATGGTITVTGNLTALGLSTIGNAYNVTLSGGGAITNAVSFLNTGTLTIGASGFTFTGGAIDTAGAKSFAGGTIQASNAALNFGTTAVTLTGNTTFNAGSGLVTLGPTTGAASNLILVGSGGATIASAALGTGTLNLTGVLAGATVQVTGALTAQSLATAGNAYDVTLNGGGTITNAVTFTNTGTLTIGAGLTFNAGATGIVPSGKSFAGTISANNAALNFGVTPVTLTGNTAFNAGTGLVTLAATTGAFDLAIQGSGGAAIASANLGAAAGTLDLSGATGGTITVTGNLTALGLSTIGNGYNVALNGGGTITNAVIFSNTGSLSIGAAGFAFTGGATDTSGAKSFAGGTISAPNQALNFGVTPVTLTGNTTFNAGSGLVTLGPTTGAFILAIQGSGGATIASAALGAGTLDLTGVLAGAAVQVTGALTAATLSTVGNAYSVALNGGGTISGAATTFSNTGTLTIGAGMAFTNGVDASAGPGTVNVAGTVSAVGAGLIDLGAPAVNVTASAVLGGTSTGQITVGPASLASSATLTLGAGTGAPISTGSITGPGALPAANLTINTTGAVAVGGAVGTNIGTVTVTNSNGVTFSGPVSAATVAVNDSQTGATLDFQGNLTVNTGMGTAGTANAYNLRLAGANNLIAGASPLNHTGTLIISATTTAFTGGVVAVSVSSISVAGIVSAAGAGVINFGAVPLSVTGASTLGGASTGQITLGTVSIANGVTLTLGAGAATPVQTGAVDGAGPGTSNVTVNTAATATFGGVIGGAGRIGTLTIQTGTVDVLGNNFTIGTLVNSAAGVFALDGTQLIQTITVPDTVNGTVSYKGAAGGTIRLASFHDLQVNRAGQTFTLAAPIVVSNDLLITNGTLDVSAGNCQISVSGDWLNTGPGGTFTPRMGTVIFNKPAGTIQIFGNNLWFIFDCQIPGITIVFEANKTQTIVDVPGALFRVRGLSGNNINLTSSDPMPPPPSAPNGYWIFTLSPNASVVQTEWVTVDASSATPYDVPVPSNVTITAPGNIRCPGWKSVNAIRFSGTVDVGLNGKIDRILVSTQFNLVRSAAAFSGFVVQVTGYTLNTAAGSVPGSPFDWTDGSLAANEFWIRIEEKPYLDTGAVPVWEVMSNSTLRDSGTETYYVPLGNVTPDDTAKPMIGYTLAVADKNEIFIHFSEYVRYDDGATTRALQLGDISYSGAEAITAVTRVTTGGIAGDGTSEVLLTLDNPIPATEVVTPTTIAAAVAGTIRDINPTDPFNPSNPSHAFGQHWSLVSDTHRVTDVGLGLLTNGVEEPLFAHDETQSGPFPGGIGLISLGGFDGTKWLRTQNITLEGHIHSSILLNPASRLWFDMSVPAANKTASGLWLPPFDVTQYNGIVPLSNSAARSLAGTPNGAQLRDYLIPRTDSEVVDGMTLEFFFQILAGVGIANDLYTARVVDPAAVDWYRHVMPWSFALHEIRVQRGGVQILKNVINPDKGEVTTLQFVQTKSGQVTVTVFDLSGSIIRILVRQKQAAGDYGITWDGTNRGGRKVTRGIYFIRVVGPEIDETRKVLVVR